MPKYLIQASYTADGIQGLLKDGGSKRRAAAEQAIKGLGGIRTGSLSSLGRIAARRFSSIDSIS